MRLIDADACRAYFYEHLDDNGVIGAMNAIEEMPTIDAVHVIRCADCVHGRVCKFEVEEPEIMICIHKNMFPMRTSPGFYCAHGAKIDAEVLDGQ